MQLGFGDVASKGHYALAAQFIGASREATGVYIGEQ